MKIIVRSPNWIGDAVMSIPALKQIRRIFSGVTITLCSRSLIKDVFSEADFIDEILIFDKSDNPTRNLIRQAQIWREKDFNIAILFTNSFASALLARLADVPLRFGYSTDGRSFLLNKAFPVPEWKENRHESYFYLNLVREVENDVFGKTTISEDLDISIKVSELRRTEAREILEMNGVDTLKRTVALGVGSINSMAKRWGAEKYAKLNDLLQDKANMNVILVGSKNELDIAMQVYNQSSLKPVVLNGKVSLAQTIAILSEIDLLISNDMGLAHVAPAVGTKTLVIFGPTNEKATQPIGSEIIRKQVECAPCMLRKCPIDHRCMKLIPSEEVFIKALKMLEIR